MYILLDINSIKLRNFRFDLVFYFYFQFDQCYLVYYIIVKFVIISGVGVVNLVVDSDRSVSLCGDVFGIQYIFLVIFISFFFVFYKFLLDNMLLFFFVKKGGFKKKDSDDVSEDDQERVERRISVRQSECVYRQVRVLLIIFIFMRENI